MLFHVLPVEAPHARATLRTEVVRAAPYRPFLAAVEIDTDPHWHVYWKNPGDSGIPTTIDWKAPKGWRVEPLEYPAPHRFAPGGVTAYGYEGKTLFLARVTPSATPGTVSAQIKWLVCANACIAGWAVLAAKVPVGGRTISDTSARRFAAALARLPSPAVGWRLRGSIGKTGVVLTATPPNGKAAPRAEFFPLESGLVDQAKPYVANLNRGDYVFLMKNSPFPETRASLRGLLVFPNRRAVLVTTKLENKE